MRAFWGLRAYRRVRNLDLPCAAFSQALPSVRRGWDFFCYESLRAVPWCFMQRWHLAAIPRLDQSCAT